MNTPEDIVLNRPKEAKQLPLLGFHQRDMYSCGFVAALGVCILFGKLVELDTVYDAVKCSRGGTSQTNLIRGLRQLGVTAYQRYDLDFDSIRRCIDLGKPLIVYHKILDHWETVYGYNIYRKALLISDGPPPNQYTWHHYEHHYASHYGIVCANKG
jgi:ABC-type bacteriocin/lantibiotic exporter with double-glycine peptidase domain